MTPYIRIHFGKLPGRWTSQAIAAAMAREIEGGRNSSGSRLPPVRVIQHQLGVARQTVARAYEELQERGLVLNKPRAGYFVASRGTSARMRGVARSCPPVEVIGATPHAAQAVAKSTSEDIFLGSVFIDKESLPIEQIQRCFKSVLGSPGLHYMYDGQGFEPLRNIIARRLKSRGIPAEAKHIVITTGSQQALDIGVRALKKKIIATENPAYGVGKLLFEMNQMKVAGLTIDPFNGVDLSKWERMIAKHRPGALYLTPNFQNPTGYSYSSGEISSILDLAQRYEFGIIEDDWGSDMLSFSEFRTPIRALAGDNVLYMNSFTKKLLPSLRIGYIVGNEANIEALLSAKRVGTLGGPMLIEAALFEFLDRGYFDRHLQKLHEVLDARYRCCLELLQRLMPDSVRWTQPGGGPILWLEIPKTIDLQELAARTAKRRVFLDTRTQDWFFGKPHLHGTKIGFAQNSMAKLERGLEVLASEIRKC